MKQDTLNKKAAGKKYLRKRWDRIQPLCVKHNLPCHWKDVCRECVKEHLPEVDIKTMEVYVDETIMNKLKVQIIKPKTKMKNFFS